MALGGLSGSSGGASAFKWSVGEQEDDGRGGPLGFIDNLVRDVKSTAMGIGPGIAAMFTQNPVDTIQAIGEATWHTWSPLFHGQFGRFAEQSYAHPLAPLLDLAAIVTLGAAGAGVAVKGLQAAGALSTTSRLARLGQVTKNIELGADDVGIPGVGTVPVSIRLGPTSRVLRTAGVDWAEQGIARAIKDQLATRQPFWFGREILDNGTARSGKFFDFSKQSQYERAVRRSRARRSVSLNFLIPAQIAAIIRAYKKLGEAPDDALGMVEGSAHATLAQHGHEITPEQLAVEVDRSASSRAGASARLANRNRKQAAAAADRADMHLVDAQQAHDAADAVIRATHLGGAGVVASRASADWASDALLAADTVRDTAKTNYRAAQGAEKSTAREVQRLEAKQQLEIEKQVGRETPTGKRVVAVLQTEVALAKKRHKAAQMKTYTTKREWTKAAADYTAKADEAAAKLGIARTADAAVQKAGRAVVGHRLRAHKAELRARDYQRDADRLNRVANKAAARVPAEFHGHGVITPYPVIERHRLHKEWVFVIDEPVSAGPEAAWSAQLGVSIEDWAADRVNTFAERLTTQLPHKARRRPNGNYVVVPKDEVVRLGVEADRSLKAVSFLAKGGLVFWKALLLGLAPRYLVNNAVGNLFMMFMATDPITTFRVLTDGWRAVHGDSKVERDGANAMKKLFGASSVTSSRGRAMRRVKHGAGGDFAWLWDAHGGALGGGSQEMMAEFRINHKFGNKVTNHGVKLINLAGRGLFNITHIYTDQLLRLGYASVLYRRMPQVKALQRQGLSFHDAARQVSLDQTVRNAVDTQMERVLGRYYDYNKFEKGLKALVPFYSWDRAIVTHVRNLPAWRLNALAEVGTMGQAKSEAWSGGDVPLWARSLIPLGGYGSSGMPGMPRIADRVAALNTSGLNPYAALAQIADATVGALTGMPGARAELMNQTNPLIQKFTDGLVRDTHTSIAQDLVASPVDNTPFYNLIKSLMGGKDVADSYTDARGVEHVRSVSRAWQGVLANWMGLPQKYVSMAALADSHEKELRRGIF